jgi:DNA primase large subunit
MRRYKNPSVRYVAGGSIPIAVADMAKYPFLPQARQHIAPIGLDYQTLVGFPHIRNRAKQRVYASFELASRLSTKRSKDSETEIISFPLAILYVAGIGDRRLIERFALFEATQVNSYLDNEEREDVILEIAKSFNWDIHVEPKSHTYTLHFAKYLEMGSKGRLFHDPKWKLVNRILDKGKVRLSSHDVRRLLREDVKRQIEDRAKQEIGKVPQEIQEDIDELKAAFLKRSPQLEEFDQIIRAQESEYPPCVSDLMKRVTNGQHLSHVERFTLVTYLLHQGISVDSVVNLFSKVSDFREDKTRYQVEHLAGQKGGRTKPYTTYNCATLQTHGVCSKPTDPICRTIKNPLTYHLRKQGPRQVPTQEQTQSGQV